MTVLYLGNIAWQCVEGLPPGVWRFGLVSVMEEFKIENFKSGNLVRDTSRDL